MSETLDVPTFPRSPAHQGTAFCESSSLILLVIPFENLGDFVGSHARLVDSQRKIVLRLALQLRDLVFQSVIGYGQCIVRALRGKVERSEAVANVLLRLLNLPDCRRSLLADSRDDPGERDRADDRKGRLERFADARDGRDETLGRANVAGHAAFQDAD